MSDFPAIFFWFLFTVWGLCFGSFFNVLIYRMPRGMSLIKPASHCPKCKRPISAIYNIPIFGWLFLGGKCANCKEPISIQYPLVELLGGALGFLGAFLAAPNAWESANFIKMLCSFWLFVTLIPIFAIDFKHLLLPDTVTIGGIILGFACSFFSGGIGWLPSLLGIIACGGILFLVGFASSKILGREGMGFGDVKLFAGFGAIMGIELTFFTLVIAASIALLIIIPFRLISNRNMSAPLPFGPFLGLSAPISFLYGEKILDLLLF